MIIKKREFVELVRSRYIHSSFSISGFAFWKIEKQLAIADVYQTNTSNFGESLYAIINQKLVFYWAKDKTPFVIPINELCEFNLINLHNRYENEINKLEKTHNIHGYFPLSYSGDIDERRVNDNFYLVTLNKDNTNNWTEIANIINESTKGNLTGKLIMNWRKELICDPDLWIGAIDKKTKTLVGVGISTYNPSVKETDLDWFYIGNAYQGRGIGRMLVQETISRCKQKSKIIRVAGVANEFYRKCGFIQRDKWYYITKKSTHVSWWDE